MLVETKALVRARDDSSIAAFFSVAGGSAVRTSKVPTSAPSASSLKRRISPGTNRAASKCWGGQAGATARSRAVSIGGMDAPGVRSIQRGEGRCCAASLRATGRMRACAPGGRLAGNGPSQRRSQRLRRSGGRGEEERQVARLEAEVRRVRVPLVQREQSLRRLRQQRRGALQLVRPRVQGRRRRGREPAAEGTVKGVASREVRRFAEGRLSAPAEDDVVAEEPLEI